MYPKAVYSQLYQYAHKREYFAADIEKGQIWLLYIKILNLQSVKS